MYSTLRRLIVPGLIFQGVVIGGGYSTGRELVEFFLSYGVLGAFCGMAVVTVLWSATLAIAFNYASLTRSFDYNSFLRGLLGPLRYLAEVVFLLMMLLVIAVIADATNTIFQSRFGAPEDLGVAFLAVAVVIGLALPERWLENAMSFWSILLYIAYASLFVLVYVGFRDQVAATFDAGTVKPGWISGAVSYAGYNLAVIPAVLFTVKSCQSYKEARITGALAGIMGMIPAVFLVLAMLAFMPEILTAPVPLTVMLDNLQVGPAGTLFDIVILGTLVQTALGSINALNERVAVEFEKKKKRLALWGRGLIGFLMIALSIGVGVQFGIIYIIAEGYSTLTIGFLLLLVLPILTVGLWKSVKGEAPPSDAAPGSIDAAT